MKKIIWDNPNKMHIETGNKGFDKACITLCAGNALTNTQWSSFVRPKNEVECNRRSYSEGALRTFDLQFFELEKMPHHFKDVVFKATETEHVILHKIYHCSRGKEWLHGWILTKTYKNNYELIKYCYANYRNKSIMVMDEVVQYVSNPIPVAEKGQVA